MMLELMMLLVPAGFILLYDGWRKRRKKEYFVHSPLTSWLFAILPIYPLFMQLERDLMEGVETTQNLFLMGALLIMVIAIIYKTFYEITHRKVNIHNMDKGAVQKLLDRLMEQYDIDHEKQWEPGGKGKYTFPHSKGKITVEPHLSGGSHQVVTFKRLGEIPMGRELLEDLKEAVASEERSFSKTLGVGEMVAGLAFLSLAVYLI